MGTRIRITNNSKQPQDIGGRWVQPGASDVFDADQVAQLLKPCSQGDKIVLGTTAESLSQASSKVEDLGKS